MTIPLINHTYQLTKTLRKGGFGILCKGVNIDTKENVALKLENKGRVGLLLNETKILRYLYEKCVPNIPPVYWFGSTEPYDYRILVIPYYECSLYEWLEEITRTTAPSPLTVLYMIKTMIDTIQHIHTHYVLHRDIKPSNIMMKGDGNIVFIDFGLSTFYINDKGKHIENVNIFTITEDELVGSPNYVSWNIHNGDIPSRRDDMISIGYIWLLLLGIHIPWFSCSPLEEKGEHKKYERLMDYLDKVEGDIYNIYICKIYMKYCYELEFKDPPDYKGIKSCVSVENIISKTSST